MLCFNVTILLSFLHVHEIVELLYFLCTLSVCLSVSLCVCVSDSACEQYSSRTDAPIWTRFSLNGCLAHWLGPYWNWWPWVKGQDHSGVISIFFFISISYIPNYISQLSYVWSNWTFVCRFDMPFADEYKNIIKIKCRMTSWWRHLSFLHTIVNISNSTESTNFNFWYKHSTTLNTSNDKSVSDLDKS